MIPCPQQLSPQDEAVALWRAIEAHGGKPTRAAIAVTLRQCFGLRFRDAELVAWLRPFRNGHVPAHNGHAAYNEGARDGHAAERASARAAKVPLFPNSDPPAEDPHVASQPRGPRTQALKLPYDRELLDQRYAILKAVWGRVQPIIGRSTTFSDWRKRNSEIALSLAKGGFSPEQVVFAWEQASARGPVRELSIVQRYIERVESYEARVQA